jgi:hypothetical protein
MKPDCRNDCVEPLRFPKRADNRPGLSHIDYRIGAYADIREALLRNLDKTAILSQWTHRGADDPGIALLEGAAILCDILTFYQELYANEAYLRTAQWKESIADLVRLLGYRLSPGLGGSATFAFEIKGDKPVTVPAGFPLKAQVDGLESPADFETSDEAIIYPWLSRFNLFRPLQTPNVTSATTEFYIQAPDQLTASSPVSIKPNDRLLIGDANSMTNPAKLSNAEIVIVDSVGELHGMKVYKIKGKLKRSGNVGHVAAYKLGRVFHHFGNNGPPTIVETPDKITSKVTLSGTTTTVESTPPEVRPISFIRSLSANTGGSASKFSKKQKAQLVIESNLSAKSVTKLGDSVLIVNPVLKKDEFPLDAEVQDLPTGGSFVIQAVLDKGSQSEEFTLVRRIKSIRSTSVTWGLTTGTTSLVTLSLALDTSTAGFNSMDIREVQFHEVLSPLLTLRAAMAQTSALAGDTLNFFGTVEQAQTLTGRRLLLTRTDADPLATTVVSVNPASAGDGTHPLLRQVRLDRNDLSYADFPNLAPFPITVFGNIVDATQGKTEQQTPLGNGDSRQTFQTFKLPKSPVTYLLSQGETPPETPELQIYVNNRLWTRATSFFGRRYDEEIYIVREDADNVSWVQFGDGKTGARLPSGLKNVVAKYRTGTGAFGALKPDTKVQPGGRIDRLDKIQMPGVAAGGAQPEDGDMAREAAPGKVQSLGRLVSISDFERETLAIPGVRKASAAWRLVDNIPVVVITVLMDTGRQDEIEEVREVLAGYNQFRGPNRFPILVNQGFLQYVTIGATFGYDPTYLAEDLISAVSKALGINSGKPNARDDQSGLFSLRQRSFGQREYATKVAGAIQNVAGVRWAEVTAFASLGAADDPASIPLPSPPGLPLEIVACEVTNLLSLYAGHLTLNPVADTPQEVN